MFGFKTKDRKDDVDIIKEFEENGKAEDAAAAEEDKKAVEDKKLEEAEAKAEEVKVPEEDKLDEKKTVEPVADPSPEEKAQELIKQKEELEKKVKEKKEAEEATEKEEEDKEKKRNPRAEKRIGELTRQIKELKEGDGKEKRELLARLDILEAENKELQTKSGNAPESKIKDEVNTLEDKRISQYLEEDKSLPKEQRREMSEDEYKDWLIEDMTAATDWRLEQKLRAREERRTDIMKLETKVQVDEIVKKQNSSRLRVEARHPDLNTEARTKQLAAEGKDKKAIHEQLCEENVKYKTLAKIIGEDEKMAKKYMFSPDGPELLEKEMMKRLEGKKEEPKNEKITELEAEIAALKEGLESEAERKARIDVGVSSKKGARIMEQKEGTRDSVEVDKVLKLAKDRGYKIDKKEYKSMEERRSTIRGANEYGDE